MAQVNIICLLSSGTTAGRLDDSLPRCRAPQLRVLVNDGYLRPDQRRHTSQMQRHDLAVSASLSVAFHTFPTRFLPGHARHCSYSRTLWMSRRWLWRRQPSRSPGLGHEARARVSHISHSKFRNKPKSRDKNPPHRPSFSFPIYLCRHFGALSAVATTEYL
jgi:hypothetical protein